MAEWITKITGHDVRIEELIEGDYEPGLGLYFRCEWCNPYEQVIGRTWETEITFGEGSELLTDYITRHNKALWTAVDRALENNDGLEMECLTVRYLNEITGKITKAKEAKAAQHTASVPAEDDSSDDQGGDDPDDIDTQASTQPSDDRTKAELDAMFTAAGGEKLSQKTSKSSAGEKRKAEQDVEMPRVRPQAVDTVTITCGTQTMKFDVAANGSLVLSVDELAQTMGIVSNSDTLLFTGRCMADRQGNHFVISQDVLCTDCTFTLSGVKVADADALKSPEAKDVSATCTSPLPKGTTNTFDTPHLKVQRHTLVTCDINSQS